MLHDKNNGLKVVDPQNYKPGKKLLLGGGQFANHLMIVNLKEITKAENPPVDCEYQAHVIEKSKWSGKKQFDPWLWSYWLAEIPNGLKHLPIGSYILNLDGTISDA